MLDNTKGMLYNYRRQRERKIPNTRKVNNMKYTVTFSCGHEATVDLFGKTSERERRITWYEKEGICPDCYRKMKEDERRQADAELAAYADKIEVEYNLPELEGTEKQVAWARKIRAGVIRAWEAKHNIFYDEFITIRRGKVEEESNAYRYKIKHGATSEEAKAAVLEVAETNSKMQLYKRWFETTSAAWIIDNRD